MDSQKAILGVDCGHVIFHPLSGKEVEGALASLKRISESNRFDKIYIVSRAGIINRLWFPFRLSNLNFWTYTGIPERNLYFCWRNKDKAAICSRLGITHFVDDRLDVLNHLRNVVPNLYALNAAAQPMGSQEITTVQNWGELSSILIKKQ